jgi:hypothetical protein
VEESIDRRGYDGGAKKGCDFQVFRGVEDKPINEK